MNYFTKEELERCSTAVSYYAVDKESENGMKYLVLSKKIQSMIENYYEHEPHCDNVVSECQHESDGFPVFDSNLWIDRCIKCGEFYR